MSPNTLPREAFPDIFPPRRIHILGAGRFGRMAAERLKDRFPEAFIKITDEDAGKIAKTKLEVGIAGEVEESISAITKAPLPPDLWLIPAVPIHVGFEWVLRELSRDTPAKRLSVPESADARVPNPIRSQAGTLYASFATFICPDYCKEPDRTCTKTGKTRQGNLFQVFGGIELPQFDTLVLRSWQLAPGVGGYPARALREMLSTISQKPGKYIIGTSCRCHGVLDALEWGPGC